MSAVVRVEYETVSVPCEVLREQSRCFEREEVCWLRVPTCLAANWEHVLRQWSKRRDFASAYFAACRNSESEKPHSKGVEVVALDDRTVCLNVVVTRRSDPRSQQHAKQHAYHRRWRVRAVRQRGSVSSNHRSASTSSPSALPVVVTIGRVADWPAGVASAVRRGRMFLVQFSCRTRALGPLASPHPVGSPVGSSPAQSSVPHRLSSIAPVSANLRVGTCGYQVRSHEVTNLNGQVCDIDCVVISGKPVVHGRRACGAS